jgi:hypothetical protein
MRNCAAQSRPGRKDLSWVDASRGDHVVGTDASGVVSCGCVVVAAGIMSLPGVCTLLTVALRFNLPNFGPAGEEPRCDPCRSSGVEPESRLWVAGDAIGLVNPRREMT